MKPYHSQLISALLLGLGLVGCGGSSDPAIDSDTTDPDVTTVRDSTPPTIEVIGDNPAIIEFSSTYNDEGATATDTTDGAIAVALEGVVNTQKIGNYTLTYTASDAAGNSASETRIVQVVDTTAPVIKLTGDVYFKLYYGEQYITDEATAIDNVDGEVQVSTTGSVDTLAIGIYTILYTAVDSANNKATLEKTVEVAKPQTDIVAPIITLIGDNPLTIEHGSDYTEAGATAWDLFDGDVNVIVSGIVDINNTDDQFVIYTAKDKAGNTATENRLVKIVDVTPPVISINGEQAITIEHGTMYVDAGATAYDDLDGTIQVTTNSNVDTSKLGDFSVLYVATDKSGNTISQARTVTVIDTKKPVISLNGAQAYQVFEGKEYNELDAKAIDAADGELAITIDGHVDITTLGKYTLTYTATDSSGNTASVIRTIEVVQDHLIASLVTDRNFLKCLQDAGHTYASDVITIKCEGPAIHDGTDRTIGSVSGVESFISLESFWLSYSSVSDLDFTSNPLLKSIDTTYASISSLNITNNSLLEKIHLHRTNLLELNISSNRKLKDLSLVRNPIPHIDTSNNIDLKTVYFFENKTRDFNFQNNVNLINITIENQFIKSIDLRYNKLLESLLLPDNQLTKINLSNNKLIRSLSLSDNQLTDIDLSNNNELYYLNLSSNLINEINLDKNEKIKFIKLDSDVICSGTACP